MSAPARGYSWPPFERDNVAALKHGAWSPRSVDPVAEELISSLLTSRPDLEPFPDALAAWARAEARVLLVEQYVLREGLLDEEGEPRPVVAYVARFERLAGDLRKQLGLDPLSAAKLHRERALAATESYALDDVRERGRAALAGVGNNARDALPPPAEEHLDEICAGEHDRGPKGAPRSTLTTDDSETSVGA